MEFLNEYISVVGLAAALAVGFIVKNLIPNEKINRFIPLIAALVGLVVCLWDAGWVATPQVIVTGMVSGLASTGLYEAFKNFIAMSKVSKEPEDEN